MITRLRQLTADYKTNAKSARMMERTDNGVDLDELLKSQLVTFQDLQNESDICLYRFIFLLVYSLVMFSAWLFGAPGTPKVGLRGKHPHPLASA